MGEDKELKNTVEEEKGGKCRSQLGGNYLEKRQNVNQKSIHLFISKKDNYTHDFDYRLFILN